MDLFRLQFFPCIKCFVMMYYTIIFWVFKYNIFRWFNPSVEKRASTCDTVWTNLVEKVLSNGEAVATLSCHPLAQRDDIVTLTLSNLSFRHNGDKLPHLVKLSICSFILAWFPRGITCPAKLKPGLIFFVGVHCKRNHTQLAYVSETSFNL